MYDTTLRCGDSRSPQGSPCPFFCLIADLYLDPKWEAFTFFDVLTSPLSLPVSRPLLEGPQHGSRVRMCSSNLPSCQDSAHTGHHLRPCGPWQRGWGIPWNLFNSLFPVGSVPPPPGFQFPAATSQFPFSSFLLLKLQNH